MSSSLPSTYLLICRWVWCCLPIQDSLRVLLPSCLPLLLALQIFVGDRRRLPWPLTAQFSGDIIPLLSSPVLCCCLGLTCHPLPFILSRASLHFLILLSVLLLLDPFAYPLSLGAVQCGLDFLPLVYHLPRWLADLGLTLGLVKPKDILCRLHHLYPPLCLPRLLYLFSLLYSILLCLCPSVCLCWTWA